jgi:hypothetical protein
MDSAPERDGIVSSFHQVENRLMANKTILLDTFTKAYLHAMAWTEDPHPGAGEYPEPDYQHDFAPEVIQDAIKDCKSFQEANRADLDEVSDTYHVDDSQHGHDFWLTRNGHGAGFWDRGYLPELSERLSDASKTFGTYDVEYRRGKFRRM